MEEKVPYIEGPYMNISPADAEVALPLYQQLAEVCRLYGNRGHVPHEHLPISWEEFSQLSIEDPKRKETVASMDTLMRNQLNQRTNCVVLVAIWPSWARAGKVLEIIRPKRLPVILLAPTDQNVTENIREDELLAGKDALYYSNAAEARVLLGKELQRLAPRLTDRRLIPDRRQA